jgi:hypothetical protein
MLFETCYYQLCMCSTLVSCSCHAAVATTNLLCFSNSSKLTQCDLCIAVCTTGSSRHLHMPGYYVAVDHTDKSVVLALRGTASVKVGASIKHQSQYHYVTLCCTAVDCPVYLLCSTAHFKSYV